MNGMLEVKLLGSPLIAWEGSSLPLLRRQVRALLYCLATHDQFLSRDTLCFLFWSNIPDASARRHLSHLLSHLRKDLPDESLLKANKTEIGLDSQRTWSDTKAFEQLLAMGTVEALQQAVDLYRGYFLSGFSLPGSPEFERWVSVEGCGFENRYLSSLAALTEHAKSCGDFLAAIDFAQRYLVVDNLAEAAHRNLIELFSLTGNRNAAMGQFERCAVILERELGVNPMPETRAVYDAVLKNRAKTPSSPKIDPIPMILPTLEVPLVGRDEVLGRLEWLWSQSKHGQAQVVFISGEAGIGKSRVLKAFADQHKPKALILSSDCHPVIRAIPYQPLVEALSPVVVTGVRADQIQGNAETTNSVQFSLSKTWLAELARLLPDLHTLYPDLPAPLPVRRDEARGRLFEALGRMILDLASKPQPLLLIIDDLHWADKATLEWLVYFVYYLHKHESVGSRPYRLMILIAYRKEEEQTLFELRGSLAKTIGLIEMELPGLHPEAVNTLVDTLISSTPKLDAIDRSLLTTWLMQVTGNNPFFLIEILRSILEKGAITGGFRDLTEIPLPNSLRLAVDERVRNLSYQARQVLEAGAVINGVFDFNLVHQTAGRDELETNTGLEELTAQQFFIEEQGKFRFRHDLIQQVVVDGLVPVRRQLLHRRAGYALEKSNPEAVTTLAYHFTKGNQPQKAVQFHSLSAQGAEQLFAWQEAERHQEHVLSLLDQMDPAYSQAECNQMRAQVLASRAHLRYLQGRMADRDQDLGLLDALAQTGTAEMRLTALREKVRYLNLDSHYEKAIFEAQEGLNIANQLGDHAAAARLLEQIGFAHYLLGQPQHALTALEAAMAMTEKDMDEVIRGHISHILGYVHFHLANYSRALTYQQEAYTLHEGANDYNRMAWDGLDIGLLLLKIGRLPESKQCLDDHVDLARRIIARPPEAYGLTLIGIWHLYQGDYFKATKYFKHAFDLQIELRSGQGSVAAESGMGLSLYHLGDVDIARQWLESAANRARSIVHRRRLVEILVMRGLVEISAAKFECAFELLQEVLDIARASEFYEGLTSGLATLARYRRLTGEPDTALSVAQEALQIALEKNLPMNMVWAHVEIGLACLEQGELSGALTHTEGALSLLPQAHQAWIGIEQVHWAHAKVLQALKRPEEAKLHQDKAEDCLMRKAALIPDPQQRQRYCTFTRSLLLDQI